MLHSFSTNASVYWRRDYTETAAGVHLALSLHLVHVVHVYHGFLTDCGSWHGHSAKQNLFCTPDLVSLASSSMGIWEHSTSRHPTPTFDQVNCTEQWEALQRQWILWSGHKEHAHLILNNANSLNPQLSFSLMEFIFHVRALAAFWIPHWCWFSARKEVPQFIPTQPTTKHLLKSLTYSNSTFP